MSKTVYYSYIRFSTPDQQKGDSERRQLETARAYVEKQGGILDESKTLKDLGVSAFTGANTRNGSKLGEFLRLIEQGKIEAGSILIVEALDRISRSAPMEQFDLISKILKAGVSIHTLFDGRTYSRHILNTDLAAMMYLQVLIVRAHEESKTKQKRLRESWIKKRRSNEPMTGRCPAWLRLEKDERGLKRYARIEDRCKIVEQIFALALRGKGKIAIARELNESRVESWGTGKRERKGAKTGWYPSYVKKILNNRAVLGEFQPHQMNEYGKRQAIGDIKRSYFPQIISDETFTTVHGQKKRNASLGGRKSANVHNLFSNVARCGYCSSPMHFKNHGKGRTNWQYLVCSKAKRGLGCSSTGWPYWAFEVSFLNFITELDFSSVFDDKKDERLAILENNLALKEGQKAMALENQAKLKALLLADPSPSFRDVLAKADSEVAMLETDIQKLGSELALARQNAKKQIDFSQFEEKISQPDFRNRVQDEIRRRVKKLDLFPMGADIGEPSDRFFVAHLDSGDMVRIQPDLEDPARYKVISVTSPERWRVPFHTYGQNALILASGDGHTFEFVADSESKSPESKTQDKKEL